MSDVRRTVILGAAGRDFHNFNVLYRDDATREVVAFTATQIPDIAGRRYPAELAGLIAEARGLRHRRLPGECAPESHPEHHEPARS